MHASEGSALRARGDVPLRNDRLQPMREELPLTERAGEETAVVLASFQINDIRIGEGCFGKYHSCHLIFVVGLCDPMGVLLEGRE